MPPIFCSQNLVAAKTNSKAETICYRFLLFAPGGKSAKTQRGASQ
jgi:hypothetical protein